MEDKPQMTDLKINTDRKKFNYTIDPEDPTMESKDVVDELEDDEPSGEELLALLQSRSSYLKEVEIWIKDGNDGIETGTDIETISCGHPEESSIILPVAKDKDIPAHFISSWCQIDVDVYACGQCGAINETDISWSDMTIEEAQPDMREVYAINESEPPDITRNELDRLLD